MEKTLKNNKPLLVLVCLLISSVLWLYVVAVQNPEGERTISGVKVTFVGEDALSGRSLAMTQGNNATVTLTFRGMKMDLAKLDKDKIEVKADMSNIMSPGEALLAYEVTPVSGVTLSSRSPDYIGIKTEQTSMHSVEIKLRLEGKIADGYVAGEAIFEPASIQVHGVQSLTDTISYAEIVIKNTNIDKTISRKFDYVLLDENGNQIDRSALTTDDELVNVTLPVFKTKDLPLSVDILPGGGADVKNATFSITPQSIRISGDSATVDSLNAITIGSIDLSQIISSSKLTFPILLPNDVTNLSGETGATVTVEVKGLETRVLDCENIEIVNIPKDYSVVSMTNSLPVTLRGPEASLDQVYPHNLRAVADMEGVNLMEGQQLVPVRMYVDGFADVGAVSEYKITIQVERVS